MVGGENLRAGSVQVLHPFDLHPGTAEPEIVPGPTLHAEVDGWRVSGAVDLQVVDPDGIHIHQEKEKGAYTPSPRFLLYFFQIVHAEF
jgi:hypothetical protein